MAQQLQPTGVTYIKDRLTEGKKMRKEGGGGNQNQSDLSKKVIAGGFYSKEKNQDFIQGKVPISKTIAKYF